MSSQVARPTGTVGSRIAAARRRRGLSQAELAGDSLSASYVSMLEADKRLAHRRVLETLAERLGCSADYLQTGVEPRERERVELELRYAELARRSGELAEARSRYATLVDDPATLAQPGLQHRAVLGLARCLESSGELSAAIARFEDLRTLAEDDPAVEEWWPAVIGLVRCHHAAGDVAYAIEIGEEARSRLRSLGLLDCDLGVQLVATLVAAYYDRGDVERARVLIEQAIGAADRVGSPVARGSAYWNASLVANEQGRMGEALLFSERALALFGESEDATSQAALKQVRGWLLLRTDPGRAADALATLDVAARELAEAGAMQFVAYCDAEAARALLLLGRPADAAERAMLALERLRGGSVLEAARSRIVLAAAQFALGNDNAAVQAYDAATAELAAAGAGRQAAAAWLELADILERAGRAGDALSAYRRATEAAGLRAVVAATEPVATEAVATEPVTTEPVTTEPVATEAGAAEAVQAAAAEPAKGARAPQDHGRAGQVAERSDAGVGS